MLTMKHNGLVVVLEYDSNSYEDAEKLQRLKEIYGDNRIIHRSYMVKEYQVPQYNSETKQYEMKKVTIPYYNNKGLNRHERRRSEKLARMPLHGVTKTNATARTKKMRY